MHLYGIFIHSHIDNVEMISSFDSLLEYIYCLPALCIQSYVNFGKKNSESYEKAASIKSELNKKQVKISLNNMNTKCLEATVRVFRTASKSAKNRPFVDL